MPISKATIEKQNRREFRLLNKYRIQYKIVKVCIRAQKTTQTTISEHTADIWARFDYEAVATLVTNNRGIPKKHQVRIIQLDDITPDKPTL